ncbi:hypothetical protein RN001_013542 [Aquatica leii]|uniref:HORMA domain-containing protein n=1 Tax=Aquatica leii TaxID=1421715 RepID=A0AAN7P066_9COLE|nr:hypothetical protein RN001_013542 [Aquatica leii]
MAATKLACRGVTNALIHNAVATNEDSKKYIEKLIPTAIGFILHQRTDLSRADFETYTRNGLMYKTFKKKVRNPIVKQLCKWIIGALDAFTRNYLRELYLVFTDTVNTEILESYKFQITYQQDNLASDISLLEQNLRKATDKLLLSISKLNMEKLKTDEFLPYICLTYYDQVTPVDYEPPFYEFDDYNSEGISLLENSLQLCNSNIILGCVDTSFHLVQCQCKTIQQSNESNRETSETLNSLKINDSNELKLSNYRTFQNQLSSSSLVESQILKSENSSKELKSDLDTDERWDKFNCSCLLKETFYNIDVVECSKCSCLQHISCLGFLGLDDVMNPYICKTCKDKTSTSITLSEQFFCIFRLILAYIFFNKRFPYQITNDCPKIFLTRLIQKLENLQIIDSVDGRHSVRKEIDGLIIECFRKWNQTNDRDDKSDVPNKRRKF